MFEDILKSHFTRYPAMQIQDIYKLIHQAALGSEHAISNPEAAYAWLTREINEMGEGMAEPVMDPISADGEIVRVHLRPYIASGKAIDLLLNAFLRTAQEFHGDPRTLERYWKSAIDMGRFPRPSMEEFIRPMKVQNYPAVHHSPDYEKLYRPAYRVVWRKVCSFAEISA